LSGFEGEENCWRFEMKSKSTFNTNPIEFPRNTAVDNFPTRTAQNSTRTRNKLRGAFVLKTINRNLLFFSFPHSIWKIKFIIYETHVRWRTKWTVGGRETSWNPCVCLFQPLLFVGKAFTSFPPCSSWLNFQRFPLSSAAQKIPVLEWYVRTKA
jgi:hypothetical protein